MSVLQAQDLTIGYNAPRRSKITVAQDLNLALNAGELVCLLGPNGAGKSTLMRTLAGMQKPLQGSVTLLGDNIFKLNTTELAQRLSIVLTGRIQTGLLTGYGLVALGRHPYTHWSGGLSKRDEAVIRWAVEAVGAEDLAPRRVVELSDGERQKLMIARALAQEPQVILLDEPTAFLDLPRRVEIMRLLRHLAQETGRAVLVSTHDLDLALRTAHKLWLMPKGGNIQVGAPEDLILSGAFEGTFQGEGVTFDIQSGSFRMDYAALGTVKLRGEGVNAVWTQRALERAGYQITTNGTPALAMVEVLEGGQWQIHTDQAVTQHHSIDELLNTMKQLSDKE
jgi:iron complex transport system ATP-binding protein